MYRLLKAENVDREPKRWMLVGQSENMDVIAKALSMFVYPDLALVNPLLNLHYAIDNLDVDGSSTMIMRLSIQGPRREAALDKLIDAFSTLSEELENATDFEKIQLESCMDQIDRAMSWLKTFKHT